VARMRLVRKQRRRRPADSPERAAQTAAATEGPGDMRRRSSCRRRAPRGRRRTAPATMAAGRGRPPDRVLTWVSKTDLSRFLRCPYAFWAVDRGRLARCGIRPAGPRADCRGQRLPRKGPARHPAVARIHARARGHTERRAHRPGAAAQPGASDLRDPGPVIPADGDLLPVEVKSHHDVRHADLLELAFCWLLMGRGGVRITARRAAISSCVATVQDTSRSGLARAPTDHERFATVHARRAP